MVSEDKVFRYWQNKRVIIGIIVLILIELPLLLLLSLLTLNHLISWLIYYMGLLLIGIGGLFISLKISKWYLKKNTKF